MSQASLTQDDPFATPPALLAIMRAARRSGDKHLEREARKELAERFGIEVTFRRQNPEGVRRAQ